MLSVPQIAARIRYQTETDALIARITARTSGRRARLMDDLIKALKDAGIWQTRDFFYVFAGSTTQAATRNWIADAYNATLSSSPTFTADQGYQTNGTSSYVDSNFAASTAGGHLSQNDMSFGFWSLTDGAATTSNAGRLVSGSGISVVARDANDAMSGRANMTTPAASANGSVPSGLGLRSVARNASNAFSLRANGIEVATGSTASVALVSGTIKFGSAQNGSFSAAKFAAGHAGGYLTTTQEAALNSALSQYLGAIGAI